MITKAANWQQSKINSPGFGITPRFILKAAIQNENKNSLHVLNGIKRRIEPRNLVRLKRALGLVFLTVAMNLFFMTMTSKMQAATKTWNGGTGETKNWTTGSNWSPTGAPAAADDIVFNTAGAITFSTMPASVSYNSLAISQGTVTLVAGTNMTLTLGGNAGTDFTVSSGASLIIGANVSITLANSATASIAGSFTINDSRTYNTNGTSVITTVTGTLINAGTVTNTTPSKLVFNSPGIYRHNYTTAVGNIPVATWNTGSTCEIAGYTTVSGTTQWNTAAATGWGQSFYHFTWNCPSQTFLANLGQTTAANRLQTINGNFTVTSTGSGTMQLGSGSDASLSVGGNCSMTGGNFTLSGGNSAGTMSVDGDFSFSSSGTFTMNGGTGDKTLNVTGNFSHTNGIITETGGGTGFIIFDGSTVQTYTSGGTVSNTINFTVNNGATLQMAAAGTTVTGGGAFTLAAGGTLGVTSTVGITTSGATGNIQVTGTRTYTAGSHLIYNGTANQAVGNGLTSTNKANLTIDNPGNTVTLGVNTTITGTLTVTAGSTLALSTFNLGSPTTLTMSGGATAGSSITGTTGTLTLGGNVTINDATTGTVGASISCPVALGATRTFTVADDGTSATDLTISSVISGATFGVTKAGTGTMALIGGNTYTGAVTINAGILAVNIVADASTNSSLGTGAGTPAISIAAAGTLQYTGSGHSSNRAITLTGSGGTIDASGSGTLTLSGGVTGNTNNLVLTGTGAGVQNGVIGTTSGTVTKNGAGTWTLSGANTFSGAMTISAGTLIANTVANASSSSSLGTGATTAAISIGATGTLRYTGSGHSSSRAITLTGSGGTIDASGSGTLTLSGGVTGNTNNLVLTGTGAGVQSGVIGTSSGTVIKNGAGTWTLSNSNTYTGATTVSAGTLKLGANGGGTNTPLGTTGSGTTVSSGGTLDLNGFTLGTAEGLNLNGTGVSNNGALTNTGGNASYSGAIVLQSASEISTTSSGTLTLSGNMSGNFAVTFDGDGTGTYSGIRSSTTANGTLIKEGAGTWTLSNSNTYTGTTTISAGTLIAGANAPSGSNGAFGNATSVITLGDAATTTNNSSPSLLTGGAFTIGRGVTIANQATSGIYTIGGNTANTSVFSGTITMNKPLSVTQVASGTVQLGGTVTANTNKLTKIGAGTLQRTTNDLSLDGDFEITTGTYDANGQTTTVAASHPMTVSGGIYTAGSATQTFNGGLVISGGTFTGAGGTVTTTNMTLSSGTLTAPSGTFNVTGNWSKSGGTFTPGSNTVTFNGGSAQNISGSQATAFNSLTLNNTSGLTLSGSVDATVTGTLTITNGKITTGSNKLIVGSAGSSGTINNAGAGKYVYGNLRRFVANTSAPTVDYPIGDASNYTPVSITFAGTTSGSGYLEASTTATAPGGGAMPSGAGLDASKYINRRWVVTNTGVAGFTNYSPTFTFVAGDIQGSANTANLVVRKLDGGTWSATTNGTRTGTTTQCTGLTSFSEFACGEDACTAPSFTACPSNIDSNTDAGLCTAVVNYTATASGTPAATYSYEFTGATTGSGSGTGTGAVFNKGVTTVTITALNDCGDDACSFDITVTDDEAPTITCAADQTQTADAGMCNAAVTVVGPTSFDDNCPGSVISNNYNSTADASDTYPVGTTTVIWTVTDAHGHTATCSQDITVTDDEAPTITCAADQTQTADAGMCNTAVTVVGPTSFDDNCPGSVISNNYNSMADASDTYPVGTTTVIWTVTDAHGNTTTCSQDITVTDDEAPTITCAADQTQTADAGMCNAAVTVVAPAFDDNCPGSVISNNYNSTADASDTYPVGTTTVIWTVTDAHGHTATCSQDITVTDDEAPTITCAADQTQTADAGMCNAAVTVVGPTSFDDNCPGSVISNNYNSTADASDTYPVGTTTVIWTVTDAHGHTATCSQDITVTDDEAPTITCAADQTQTADAGMCNTAVTVVGPTSFDDNCPGSVISNNYNSTADASDTYPVGTTTVIWTVTDAHGNTTTCSQDITVTDDEAPTITCAADQTQTADAGMCNAAVTVVGPTSFDDNCPGSVISNNYNSTADASDTYPVGTTTVIWTVTDAHGHTATCSQDITVTDDEAPTITCAADQTQTADAGMCNAAVTVVAPAFDDNCPGSVISNNYNSTADASDTYPVGTTTVIWTVTDAHGHTATCSQDITVTDDEAPTITCAADQTQTADAGMCNAAVTVVGPTSFDDNCPGSVISNNYNSTADASDTYPVGTTTVIWTVTDAHGHTATCSQDITVTDDEAPTITCAADQTQTADAGMCNTAVTVVGPTSFDDNCPGSVISNNYNSTADASDTYPVGTTTVIWTVTDAHGNTTTCSQDITVTDDEAPTITCAADQTQTADAGMCNAAVTVVAPAFDDNCPGSVISNNYNSTADASDTYPVGTTTVIWTVTDAHGHTATCSQDITVTDDEAPTITCAADQTQTADAGMCNAAVTVVGPTSFDDNCPGSVISNNYNSTADASDTYPVGTTTVIWTVTDAHGHTATCSQDITVTDDEAPTITCAADQTQTADAGMCNTAVTVVGPTSFDDNCPGSVISNNYNSTADASDTYPVGTTTVIWTVTDAHGHTATCSQDITVTDDEAPTITCAADQTQTADAGMCNAAVTVVAPAFDDNCPGSVISNNYNSTADASDTYPVGTTTVIWTVTDAHGHTATCSQDITVTDDEAPTITCAADQTQTADAGMCNAAVTVVGPTSFDDNCPGSVISNNYNSTADASDTYPVGTTTVIWTVTDAHGHTATCSQDITVTDDEAPTITCAADQTQTADAGMCNTAVTVVGPTSFDDNCPGSVISNNYNSTADASDTYPVGTTTVIWTVTDAHGNTTTCSQDITVTDDEAPTITCAADQTQTADAGMCNAAVTVVGPTSFDDNCPGSVISNNYNSTADASDTYPVGTTTVIWTVTDAHGHTTTCSQDITVTDDEAPTITCAADQTQTADAGMCNAAVTVVAPAFDDNCPGSVISNNYNSTADASDTYPVGTTTVIWTVTDAHGHTATCSQDITVTDDEAPSITCPTTVLVNTDDNSCVATNVVLGSPVTDDNCGVLSFDNDHPSTTYPIGNTNVTWTVEDIHGNTSTCIQVVTVTNANVVAVNISTSTTTICSGTVVPFTATPVNGGTNPSYQWKVNNVNKGTNSPDFTPATLANGNVVTCVMTSNIACPVGLLTKTSNPIQMSLIGAPAKPGTITQTSGKLKLCPGDTASYSIAPVLNATNLTWTAPSGSTIISGQNTTAVTLAFSSGFAASGSLSVVAENDCGFSQIQSKTITRNTLPVVNAISGTSPVACVATGVSYSVNMIDDASFNWYFNNSNTVVASGNGTNSILADFSGFTTTTLYVSATTGCGTSALKSKVIQYIQENAGAISGPTSVCSLATNIAYSITPLPNVTSYTWTAPNGATISDGVTSQSGSLITGSASVTINFGTKSGAVKVKSNNCSSGTQSTLNVSVTSCIRSFAEANEQNNSSISLFPNPARELINVIFQAAKETRYEIRVYDALGKEVLQQVGQAVEGSNQTALNLSGLATGVYLVRVNGENINYQARFTVE